MGKMRPCCGRRRKKLLRSCRGESLAIPFSSAPHPPLALHALNPPGRPYVRPPFLLSSERTAGVRVVRRRLSAKQRESHQKKKSACALGAALPQGSGARRERRLEVQGCLCPAAEEHCQGVGARNTQFTAGRG